MSTKTTFKRIALVAVAALGFGVLSVVPSQAAVTGLVVTVTNGNATHLNSDSSTAASIKVQYLALAGASDSVSVQVVAAAAFPTGSTDVLTNSGFFFTESSTSLGGGNPPTVDSATANAAENDDFPVQVAITKGAKFRVKTPTGGSPANGTYSATMKFSLGETRTGLVAGTYSFNLIVSSLQASGVVTQVVPFNIVKAAEPVVVVTPAAASAKAYIQAGNAAYPSGTVLADSVTVGSLVAGTRIGTLRVSNFSSTNVAAKDTMTVTMTGPGYLTVTTGGSVTGRSFVIANETTFTANIIADGTAGTGTITITTVAGASIVKTVTFFDTKPVTATAVAAKAYIKAGATSTDVFAVTVKDTLGNAITDGGVVVTAAATDATTTVGGAATCAWNALGAAYHCSVTGKAADKFGPVAYTITATGTGTNAAVKVTTTATTTFADNVATKAVLAGPSTGTPGETADYTLTLTEKNGYPVADQSYGVNSTGGVLFSATATDRVVSGWSTAPFSASESFTSKSGVITSKGTLPIAGVATGSWTLVGDGLQTLAANAIDKTIGKTKVTVTTDVANPGVDAATDAANEATDAANAATDAALAAAEAADAATSAAQEASDAVAALSESVTQLIAGLQSQIKALAKVVNKIAKQTKK
jgi:trimeric autotransporter adhesin